MYWFNRRKEGSLCIEFEEFVYRPIECVFNLFNFMQFKTDLIQRAREGAAEDFHRRKINRLADKGNYILINLSIVLWVRKPQIMQ